MNSVKSTTQALDYFETHFSEYLENLKNLVKIPSISLPGFDQSEVLKCSQSVHKILQDIGFDLVETIFIEDNKRPYLYAEWLKAPGKPTLLLYSHYDIQPVGDLGKWQSPPFELTERNGRLFGRGSADDKGGLWTELAAIDSWLKGAGSLPVNIKILIEGEEEDGSQCLDQFLEKYKERLQADAIVIVDAENFDTETAGLTVSLRGMMALSVEVKTLRQPVHSGLWGGPLPDAAMALTKMLSHLVDEAGEINVPGILEMVRPLSEIDRTRLQQLPFDLEKFRNESGLLKETPLIGSPSEVRERLWFKPKIAINAIQAGSRAQAGNIVVDTAWAKVGLRTVPHINGERAFELIKDHLEKHLPFGLKAEIKLLSLGSWWSTQTDHPLFKQMEKALELGWKREPVKIGCGASIPFVKTFTEALNGAPALLLGVADPLTQAHSENESVSINSLRNTTRTLIHFFANLEPGQ